MTNQVRTRGGGVLLWRLGNLEYGDQSTWADRAPARRGMWAFPWPFFDDGFAAHQYEYRMPKVLRQRRGWPAHPSWYRTGTGELVTATPDMTDPAVNGLDWEIDWDTFHDRRTTWMREVGTRTLQRRTFWYTGDLYTHMRPNGEVGRLGLFGDGETDWHRMDARTYADAVARSGGDRAWYRFPGDDLQLVRSSVAHLEVFLAPGEGHITGRTGIPARGRRL